MAPKTTVWSLSAATLIGDVKGRRFSRTSLRSESYFLHSRAKRREMGTSRFRDNLSPFCLDFRSGLLPDASADRLQTSRKLLHFFLDQKVTTLPRPATPEMTGSTSPLDRKGDGNRSIKRHLGKVIRHPGKVITYNSKLICSRSFLYAHVPLRRSDSFP
jgi:hypothetical protein